MSSIRPLFTITVLVVVGAFLYVKINESPTRTAGSNASSTQGIPPLAAAGGGATLAQDTSAAAPAWPPADAKAPAADAPVPAPALQTATALDTNAATVSTTLPADASKSGMPDVPAMPEMPEFPKTADGSTASQATTAPQLDLPKDVPAAQYGDQAATKAGDNTAGASAGLPALPTLPTESAISSPPANAAASTSAAAPSSASIGMPALPTGTPSANAVTPISEDRYGAGAGAATAAPAAAPSTPSDDRYGVGATSFEAPATTAPAAASPIAVTPPIPAATSGDSFAASWPAIQAALDRHDLKSAHQLLSKWHGNNTLSSAESQKVETLLGQLAGTVIYSNEHQLEPAHVVQPGETLDIIAKQYNVPWQLLAKINGIASASQVQPGQSLKVVRGPFNAIVDLHRSELTLEVDGRYAGTFPISIPPGTQVNEGPWLVEQKDAIASSRSIVLRSAANSAASLAAPKLTITASATAPGTGMPGSEIQVAPQDAEDLSDILSVGSRVTVRR